MNKSELIELLSLKKGISFKKAEEIVNTVFDSMTEAMLAGDRIEIRGFGSFVINEYKSYFSVCSKIVCRILAIWRLDKFFE